MLMVLSQPSQLSESPAAPVSSITLRPTLPEDLPSLSALFAERFGHPLPPEDWAWKYRQIPGEGHSLVAVDAS